MASRSENNSPNHENQNENDKSDGKKRAMSRKGNQSSITNFFKAKPSTSTQDFSQNDVPI